MQTAVQPAREASQQDGPNMDAAVQPRPVDLAVHWNRSRWEFASSLNALFTGPRPPSDDELPADRVLRAHWIQGKVPAGGFSASVLWHVAVIWLLILPIWGFLPKVTPTLAPMQIELTYSPPVYLPPISLPALLPKPAPAARKNEAKPVHETSPQTDADQTPARQSIISIPVRITHPRQTLIQPKASDEPPKVAPQLPNIVQWPEQTAPKPKLEFATSASAPKARERAVRDLAAPDAATPEKNAGPVNIASQTPVKLQPQMTVPAMAARAAARQTTSQPDAAAPDAPLANQATAPQPLIALSATPAPPAPSIAVPQGNLAARIAIGPNEAKAGGAGAAKSSGSGSATADNAAGRGTSPAGAMGTSSLPASVFISPGKQPAASSGGIGARPLDLKPGAVAAAQPAAPAHADVPRPRVIEPGEPPEKILSGKEVYTLHLNLPNLTSSRGSWVLSFAQLDEGERLPQSIHGDLSGPAPLETVDPKYPQSMVDQHVHGQVVLYAIIRKDGSVDSIQLVQSLDPVLDKNAIHALGQWKFEPGKRAGVPVDLEAVVYIPFEYRDLLQ